MKVYVDANPSELACVPEEGIPYHQVLHSIWQFGKTNNEAEYLAVLAALEELPKYQKNPLVITEILSDSQLVVNQLNHKYHIKESRLRELAMRVWQISGNVKFTWIPREKNLAGKLLG